MIKRKKHKPQPLNGGYSSIFGDINTNYNINIQEIITIWKISKELFDLFDKNDQIWRILSIFSFEISPRHEFYKH